AEAEHQPPARQAVHGEHAAAGYCHRRDRADQRPDVGWQDMIIVVLGAGHVAFLNPWFGWPLKRALRLVQSVGLVLREVEGVAEGNLLDALHVGVVER